MDLPAASMSLPAAQGGSRRPGPLTGARWALLSAGCIATVLAAAGAWGQSDATSRSRNLPVEPFRVVGNVYYVGANEVTSFLIATRQGHILLDGGFAETAPLIRDNIGKLGFRLRDVKVLLNSHAHFDHAGGLAQLKHWSGASLAASERDAPQLAAGGRGDYRFGDSLLFPPVRPDRLLRDGDVVTVGGAVLTAHLTPGHTPGCTTWTMAAADGGKRYDVVFVCSTTVLPGVRLRDQPSYPGIAADYERTWKVLYALPCDVFLGSHASFFAGEEKARRLRAGAPVNPFVDPAGYRSYLARAEAAFRQQLAREGL